MNPASLSALDKARLASAALRAAGVKIEILNPIEKSRRNPKSLRLAINAMCAYCMGCPDPGWKGQIRDCTATSCPLHPQRPYQTNDEEGEA